ncbi:MAG: biotin--[acetyl-CoA-carboxylase] ligase [Rhodocyclaceae bacterium]|nr:biotin--[acetyl-CoA-carboxylase] ligase [Rhodocyclaceae bacterium]MCE2980248.1 biotin--[acetyl-CoA-carboxylase] ligase [Betaproteobacteria bacterium]MCA3075423.1 biotin--[acetyl-CoA-carboxylase] ligase [Rhodocyclaceae bacterium]MCA3091908.1 biotin--[acetyl-CoA-carboxylase] ligase [Rhodocyclaceae bacterium]MCA3093198.1 biotin--[acetyl-CoA-carboxylase] ligase [Rhodocyclaceae bacterium]
MNRGPQRQRDDRPSRRVLANDSRLAARQAMRPLSFRVLRRLQVAAFTSGALLAREMSVSRSTIWTAVRDIERSGVSVEHGLGRGYRLVEPMDFIDAARVQSMLGQQARGLALTVLDHCESTNTALALQAETGAPHGSVLLAEWQTAGRGRFDRRWSSAPGAGLTFSLLWRFDKGSQLAGLSLVVGLAIADALRVLGLREVRLKWPNDVLVHRRKLAGVLTEIRGDILGPCAAVIGIGLNVRLPQATIDAIDQPVTDLARSGFDNLDRSAILGALLSGLASALERFGREGFAPFRREWQAHSASLHRTVKVALPDGGIVRGTMLGVDVQGALRIEVGGETRRVFSGELFEPGLARARARADVGAGRRPQQAEIE